MSTATVQTQQAPTNKAPSRPKAKAASSLEGLLLEVLQTGLPVQLNELGVHLKAKEVDAMVAKIASQFVQKLEQTPAVQIAEKLAPTEEEWITTQEAANRCGVSRPFVAMLLDSGAYEGQVSRTSGGHRKVLASEFKRLMTQATAKAPKTLPDARMAVDLSRLDEAKAVPSAARKQSRARARALAKTLGLSA